MDENPYATPQACAESRKPRYRTGLHRCADGKRCRITFLQLSGLTFWAVAFIFLLCSGFATSSSSVLFEVYRWLMVVGLLLALVVRFTPCRITGQSLEATGWHGG